MPELIVHASPLPDAEIPGGALTPYVLERAAGLGDKPALIDGPSGRTLTYAQLAGGIAALAGGLRARGFGPGDVLAVMAPNLPEYAIVFHGVARAGGAVTTINPTYTASEVHHQLTDSGATILVTIGMFLGTAQTAVEGTSVTEVYTLDEVEGARHVSELFGSPLAEQVEVADDDVVVLPYSSGTTGLSKGVVLTHRNLIANIAQTVSAADLTEDESLVAVLPFFHIYGMQVLMNAGLRVGATIITMPRFDLEQFLQLNDRHGCTRAYVAPPIVVALAKHPLVDDYDLSALDQIVSGAAPLSAEVGEEAARRLGCEVVQGYGMTELSPVSHMTPPGGYKPGSVGVTAPNTECAIVDPVSGESLGTDADGELWVRGPQVMKGYLNNPEATAATIDDDGWLHTGDIARIDADGHVYIVDRLKELIKYKGFQVPPAELEALLLTHPDVADAAVIGLADDEAGEIPVGYVVAKAGASLEPADVMAFVAEQVAHYKQIRQIHVVDEIPKSASGKILRRVLKDQATEG
ncbi:4-coumarate--CoA ligase family protein [Euzebya sp.]|uniref:4-coumarate--CoA ligase family protein n=1 Tax=Euzebya sp. TaxID=1971409 RepID=UPI0035118BC1